MTKKTQDEQDKKLKEANKVGKAESVEATDVENETSDAGKVELVASLWKDRLLSVDHWLRFGFMVVFVLILSVVSYLIVGLVILQFCWALIAGEGNDKLRDFGSSVSRFILHVLRFLTYNTDIKPFPFTDWPKPENDDIDK
jgi:hypothetical protein